MRKRALSLTLAILLFAIPANATDFWGTVQISTANYHRHRTLPLIGTTPPRDSNRALFSLLLNEWNNVVCSASAWEFAESVRVPVGCPKEFTLEPLPDKSPSFRLPPLQSMENWNGANRNKTVPLQLLSDYETDFSLFQFSLQAAGAFPSRSQGNPNTKHPSARHTIGDIKLFASSAITPYGYIPADGRSLSKTEYPELYQAIGDRYTDEIAERQSTFDLPLLPRAVIYYDGTYKEIIPLIRAKLDAYFNEIFFIGDIIISANPNRLSVSGDSRFSPIDEKKRTVPVQENIALYALIGDKFGSDSERKNISLPRIARKSEANEVDQVFFYIVTQGLFPTQP